MGGEIVKTWEEEKTDVVLPTEKKVFFAPLTKRTGSRIGTQGFLSRGSTEKSESVTSRKRLVQANMGKSPARRGYTSDWKKGEKSLHLPAARKGKMPKSRIKEKQGEMSSSLLYCYAIQGKTKGGGRKRNSPSLCSGLGGIKKSSHLSSKKKGKRLLKKKGERGIGITKNPKKRGCIKSRGRRTAFWCRCGEGKGTGG